MWNKKKQRLLRNIDRRLAKIETLRVDMDDLKDQLKFLRNGEDENLIVIMECEVKISEVKIEDELRIIRYLRNFING